MKIYIASDHGGFELKQQILQSGIAIMTDLGPYEFKADDDYPLFAFPLAERVAKEEKADPDQRILGILICRSGNGMAIAANKVLGIRAALCVSVAHAKAAIGHNNANILVLDADYSKVDYLDIIESFLNSEFEAGRHERRLKQISDYEANLQND